jgi:hypothetical protein
MSRENQAIARIQSLVDQEIKLIDMVTVKQAFEWKKDRFEEIY